MRIRPVNGDASPVSSLRNIGSTIALRLNEIGVHTAADLARLGPATAYQRMKAAEGSRRTPRCYYLYSLQGALDDQHWNELPPARKAALREGVPCNRASGSFLQPAMQTSNA